jgi:hypothetical protein
MKTAHFKLSALSIVALALTPMCPCTHLPHISHRISTSPTLTPTPIQPHTYSLTHYSPSFTHISLSQPSYLCLSLSSERARRSLEVARVGHGAAQSARAGAPPPLRARAGTDTREQKQRDELENETPINHQKLGADGSFHHHRSKNRVESIINTFIAISSRKNVGKTVFLNHFYFSVLFTAHLTHFLALALTQTLQLVHVTHSRAVQLHRRAVSAAAAAANAAYAANASATTDAATATAATDTDANDEAHDANTHANVHGYDDAHTDAHADHDHAHGHSDAAIANEASERARRQGATLRATLCAPIAIVCGVCDGTLTC